MATLPLPFWSLNYTPEMPDKQPVPEAPALSPDAPEGTVELLKMQYQAELDAYTESLNPPAPQPRTVGDFAVVNVVSWSILGVGLLLMLRIPALTPQKLGRFT